MRRRASRCTVEADHLLRVRQLAPVVDQEAAHAGELVLLLGLHLYRELLVRQVCAGELEGLGRLGLVLVDLAGVLVVATSLELFDALFGLVFFTLAWCVVVSRHVSSLPSAVLHVCHPPRPTWNVVGRGGLCT